MSHIGKNRLFVLVFLLILFSSFGILPVNHNQMILTHDSMNEYSLTQGIPHTQILINGDGDFASQAALEEWSGSGIEEDPYHIEGYSIFGDQCIGIIDTSVHFVIRNCHLDYNDVMAYGVCIFLLNVTNGIIEDNICSGNSMGMYVVESSYNLIENNTCIGSSGGMTGIYLEEDVGTSNFNVVANNTCSGYEEAFSISPGCSGNLVEWNAFAGTYYDVTDANLIPVNNFSFNFYNGYMGIDDNGDGFGDSVYQIEPYLNTEDPFPLMYWPSPPKWVESPTNQEFAYGQSVHYDLNVTTSAPLVWELNDTLFSIDNEGVVSSRALLLVGTYGLEIAVANIYRRSLTGCFRVTVQDTVAPYWIIEPSDQFLHYNEGFDYQLPVTDPSSIDHWAINDTTHFNLSASFYFGGSTARITNRSILEPNSYYLNISVYDVHGNRLSAILVVMVLKDPLIETTTTTTTSLTTNTTPGDVNPVMTFVLGTGMGGIVVLVIVVVALRKKS